jgi:glycerophosphoryl diester phosphodiesterase
LQRPVFGHRGNSAHAPENTIEAFDQAVALGVDGLEFDVRATREGRIVVIHDPTVDRTTDGSGPVAGKSLAELQKLDAGARCTADGESWKGRGVRIPLFEDVLARYENLPLLIEIKTPAAAAGTRQLIESHGAKDRCIVASFDHRATALFAGSGIRVGSSQRDVARLVIPARLGFSIRAPRFDVMCIPRQFHGIPVPVASLARALSAHRVLVHIWTVDDARTARSLWAAGVHGIISNDPAVILRARAESQVRISSERGRS